MEFSLVVMPIHGLEIEWVEDPELLRNISMNFVPAFGKDHVNWLHMLEVISEVVSKANFLRKKIETQFGQIHNENRLSRIREESRRSRTQPPSYKEVSSMLYRREVFISQRERSRSPRRTSNVGRRDISVNRCIGTNTQNVNSHIPVPTENNSDDVDNKKH